MEADLVAVFGAADYGNRIVVLISFFFFFVGTIPASFAISPAVASRSTTSAQASSLAASPTDSGDGTVFVSPSCLGRDAVGTGASLERKCCGGVVVDKNFHEVQSVSNDVVLKRQESRGIR